MPLARRGGPARSGSNPGAPCRLPSGRARRTTPGPAALYDGRRAASTIDNPGMSTHPTSRSDTLSYAQAGVQYDLIDPLKVAAQRAAAATAGHLAGRGFAEVT